MKKKVYSMITVFAAAAMIMAGCGQKAEQNQGVMGAAEETEAVTTTEEAPVVEEIAEPEVEEVSQPEVETANADTDAISLDISGCDTFTQIVDKLPDGAGYTNVKIGSEDALLVSTGTYDNMDGNMAAIDARVIVYVDGVPTDLGYVTAGGTAYPLAVKDDKLFVGTNHSMIKYVVSDSKLMTMEAAFEDFNADGESTYSYVSDDGGDYSNMEQDEMKSILEGLFDEYSNAQVLNFDTIGGAQAASVEGTSSAASLPAYVYPGPEAFYTVLYQYMCDEFKDNYGEAQVGIPCPVILEVDESNKEDILVYGNFEYYTYNLNGDILENVAGGSYPGVIHLKDDPESAYKVVKMEVVEDGSGYEESAKKIFGDRYDAFVKLESDSEQREKVRAQIIANYVAANNLSISAYQDYGWDPVQLPAENIDTFYSDL